MKKKKETPLSLMAKAAKITVNKNIRDDDEPSPSTKKKLEEAERRLAITGLPDKNLFK